MVKINEEREKLFAGLTQRVIPKLRSAGFRDYAKSLGKIVERPTR
tara:strand:- start:712 stop:846 length:135 start_codon:yes stop_codon:yes gene_type:complete